MARIRYSNREKVIEASETLDRLINDNSLEAVDGTYGKIVLLTKKNAGIIEKLIANDDDYFPFSQILFKYYGKEQIQKNTDRALFAVAREIDRDNSTNVWRYRRNRNSFNEMISFISDPNNSFFSKLEQGEINLPDCISQKCGTGLKSLSSKICKYLSEFAFQKDNYYINDSYIRHVLLFYLDYYDIEHPNLSSCSAVDNLNYERLYNWLSALHTERNKKYNDTITKSEIDHILWYCYKSFKL